MTFLDRVIRHIFLVCGEKSQWHVAKKPVAKNPVAKSPMAKCTVANFVWRNAREPLTVDMTWLLR